MYKVFKYFSTHDLEEWANELYERGWMLISVASATPWTFAWVFVKMNEPLPITTEEKWTEEKVENEIENTSEDLEEIKS